MPIFRRGVDSSLDGDLNALDWAAFWRHFDLARALLVATGWDGAPAWGTSDVELAVLARERLAGA